MARAANGSRQRIGSAIVVGLAVGAEYLVPNRPSLGRSQYRATIEAAKESAKKKNKESSCAARRVCPRR